VSDVIPLKRVTFILGFDQGGRAIQIAHNSNELKKLAMIGAPGKCVVMQTKAGPDAEVVTTEFQIDNFLAVEFVPLPIVDLKAEPPVPTTGV
jgi:hypothetical protein